MVHAVTGVIGEKLRDGWQLAVGFRHALLSFLHWSWPLLLLLVGPTLLVVLATALESWKGRRLGRDLLKMATQADVETFARIMGVLFTRLGFEVETSKSLGDFDIDLVIVGDGMRLAVHAERPRGRATAQYIREAAAAKEFYHCHQALFVTTGKCTDEAWSVAGADGVWVWDGDSLCTAFEYAGAGRHRGSGRPRGGVCAICGSPVSGRVRVHCLDHEEIFEGRVYCPAHQRPWRSRTGLRLPSSGNRGYST